jgi:hypothetical protein
VQAIIVGMLRVIGGGFLGLAATVAWLAYALFEGARWAPWALATISLIALLPALAVALGLRKIEPRANTPVVPSIAAIGLILLGAGLGLLASLSWLTTPRIKPRASASRLKTELAPECRRGRFAAWKRDRTYVNGGLLVLH